jgi:hypothetical protein
MITDFPHSIKIKMALKKNLMGPILFIYYEESLVSSNLNSNYFGFIVSDLMYSPVHKCWPKTSLLETRVIIKFRPILATQQPLTAFHGIKLKKKIFLKKKIQNGPLKKNYVFKTVNSQYFFVKLSRIGPWVSRIN